MPVRKKKKPHVNRQKLERARHLKQFIGEFQDIIAKAAGAEVVRYIPEYEIERMYKTRCHPVRVKAAPGACIPSHILQFANHAVTLLFKNTHVPVEVGDLDQISLYSFFSTAYTIMTHIQVLSEDAFADAAKAKTALGPLVEALNAPVHKAALDDYYRIMNLLGMWCSDMSEYLYTFKFNPEIMARGIDKAGLFNEIYRTKLPKDNVLIGEHYRPAWHIGWYYPDPEPHLKCISVPSEAIYQPPGGMLDVYIQSHALNRLSERLDGIDSGMLHFSIFDSLSSPRVCRNKTGGLLFEYAIFGDKVGYFLGELIGGKIILKTFLFLTHKGTPEADKLQAMLGLTKEDINYLDIDKLSTFTFSDITANERVKQLFIDAGCESLFNIDKELYFSPKDISAGPRAEMIEKYLQLNTLPKFKRFKQ